MSAFVSSIIRHVHVNHLLHFRFHPQFVSRHYSSIPSNRRPKSNDVVEDPQLFLRYARDQCKFGFSSVDIPFKLFHQLCSLHPRPSLIVFCQLFTAMSKIKPHPPFSTILSFSNQLELSGLRPNSYSVSIVANCYCRLGRVDLGFSLLSKLIKLGYPPHIVIVNTLLNGLIASDKLYPAGMYCKEGNMNEARAFFKSMVKNGLQPDIVTYNSLLDGFLKHAEIDRAMSLRGEMENNGVVPSIFTYTIIISGLFEAGQHAEAAELFSNLVAKGLRPDVAMYNLLIKLLCTKGLFGDAIAILKKMEDSGCSPNERTYNTISRGFLFANNVAKALEFLSMLTSQGFAADAKTASLFMGLLTSPNVGDTDKTLLQNYFLGHHGETNRMDEATLRLSLKQVKGELKQLLNSVDSNKSM